MKAICLPAGGENSSGQWFEYRIMMPDNPHTHDVEVTVELSDGRVDKFREHLPHNVMPNGTMTKRRWSKEPETVTYRYVNRKESSDSR